MPKYDNYNYNTMGFGNDPLAENADNGGLLNPIDDAIGTLLFGDADASSKIFGELTGYNKQQREFAQQEYMQDKQWAHDSAVAQMARAKEAGINLNTAAAGIAGGNVSATAPAVSSSGNPASAVEAASGVLSSISGAGLNAAESANQEASANKTNTEIPWIGILSHANNMKLFGDYVQSLKDVGMSEIHAGGIAFDLMNGGLQKSLNYLSACSGIRNIDEQMKNVKVQYEIMRKEADTYDLRMNADLSLKDKKGLQAAAEAAKLKAETWYQEQKNSLEKSIQGITMLQGGSLLFNTAWKYGVDSPQFKALEDSTYKFAYDNARGGYAAEASFAYEISAARKNGQNASDVLYGRVGGMYDALGRASNILGGAVNKITSGIDSVISAVPNAIKGKKIREELTMILNNAYEQLDKFPDDAERINAVITEMQSALQLSNSELLQWYEKSKK